MFTSLLVMAAASSDAAFEAGRVVGRVIFFAVPCLALFSLVMVIIAKRKVAWVVLLLISGGFSMVGVGGVLISSIKAYRGAMTETEEYQTVTSPRGEYEFELPADWIDRAGEAQDFGGQTSIVMGGEAKTDGLMAVFYPGMKLPGISFEQRFAETIADFQQKLPSTKLGPLSFHNQVLHRFITRKINYVSGEGSEYTYWASMIAGEHYDYRVIQWCPADREQEFEAIFENAIASFRETNGDGIGEAASQLPDSIQAVKPDEKNLPPGVTRE